MLGSSDCAGLNGAERWPLEAVLIHKTPAGLSPRLIPSSPQSLSIFSSMPYKLIRQGNTSNSRPTRIPATESVSLCGPMKYFADLGLQKNAPIEKVFLLFGLIQI